MVKKREPPLFRFPGPQPTTPVGFMSLAADGQEQGGGFFPMGRCMHTTRGESEATQSLCRPNNRVVPIAAQPHRRIFSKMRVRRKVGSGVGIPISPQRMVQRVATTGNAMRGHRGFAFVNDFSPSDTSIRPPQRAKPTDSSSDAWSG
jgi:hypothetical protein